MFRVRLLSMRMGARAPQRAAPRYALGPVRREAERRHVSWRTFLTVIGTVVGSTALLVGSVALYRSDLLRVQHIRVLGAQVVDANAAALASHVGHESLLRLDSAGASRRIETLPGVV